MNKLVFLGACLLALATQPAKAQVGAADVVVVKSNEGAYFLDFAIARAGSQPEYRILKLKDLDKLGQGNSLLGKAEATRLLLVELAQQGYTLTTTYGGAEQSPITLVFTKKQ